jgi:hypothetical protein
MLCHQEKSATPNTTPARLATLDAAKLPAPLLVPDADAAVPVFVAAAGLELPALVAGPPVAAGRVVTAPVGSVAYNLELSYATQFELAGTRAVYGTVPTDSGCEYVMVWPLVT